MRRPRELSKGGLEAAHQYRSPPALPVISDPATQQLRGPGREARIHVIAPAGSRTG